jgi:hypothetical protein
VREKGAVGESGEGEGGVGMKVGGEGCVWWRGAMACGEGEQWG